MKNLVALIMAGHVVLLSSCGNTASSGDRPLSTNGSNNGGDGNKATPSPQVDPTPTPVAQNTPTVFSTGQLSDLAGFHLLRYDFQNNLHNTMSDVSIGATSALKTIYTCLPTNCIFETDTLFKKIDPSGVTHILLSQAINGTQNRQAYYLTNRGGIWSATALGAPITVAGIIMGDIAFDSHSIPHVVFLYPNILDARSPRTLYYAKINSNTPAVQNIGTSNTRGYDFLLFDDSDNPYVLSKDGPQMISNGSMSAAISSSGVCRPNTTYTFWDHPIRWSADNSQRLMIHSTKTNYSGKQTTHDITVGTCQIKNNSFQYIGDLGSLQIVLTDTDQRSWSLNNDLFRYVMRKTGALAAAATITRSDSTSSHSSRKSDDNYFFEIQNGAVSGKQMIGSDRPVCDDVKQCTTKDLSQRIMLAPDGQPAIMLDRYAFKRSGSDWKAYDLTPVLGLDKYPGPVFSGLFVSP